MAKTEVERTCPTCQLPFRQPAGLGTGKKGMRVYCSEPCKPAGTRVVPPGGVESIRICARCSTEFINIRVGRGRDRKYCSDSCRKAAAMTAQRERITGVGNPQCIAEACTKGAQSLKGGLCYDDYQLQHRAKKFGITVEQLTDLRHAQQGRCAICCRQVTPLFIDHNHASGKVRGLLCSNCNTGIGMLQESEATLMSAIRYLREHSE